MKNTFILAIAAILSLTSCKKEEFETQPKDNDTTQLNINDTMTIVKVKLQVIGGLDYITSFDANIKYYTIGEYGEYEMHHIDNIIGGEITYEMDNRMNTLIEVWAYRPGPWGQQDVVTAGNSNLIYSVTITTDDPNIEPIVLFGPTVYGGVMGQYEF